MNVIPLWTQKTQNNHALNIFLFRIQPIQTRQCYLKSTTIYNGICTTRAEFVLHYNSHIHQMQSFDVNHLSQSSILWLCLFLRARTFAFVAVLSNYHGPELLRGLCQSKTAWWRSLRHFSFHCSPLLSKTKNKVGVYGQVQVTLKGHCTVYLQTVRRYLPTQTPGGAHEYLVILMDWRKLGRRFIFKLIFLTSVGIFLSCCFWYVTISSRDISSIFSFIL